MVNQSAAGEFHQAIAVGLSFPDLPFELGAYSSGGHIGPMRDGYVSVRSYANPVEAEMACERLRASGIAADVTNTSVDSSMFGAGNPIMHQVLYVERERMREALALLAKTPDLEAGSPDCADESAALPVYDGYFRSDWNSRERAAEFAYRGSIIGWFVPLVSWYALWKLTVVVFSDQPLRDKMRGKAIIAGVVALLPALGWLGLMQLIIWR